MLILFLLLLSVAAYVLLSRPAGHRLKTVEILNVPPTGASVFMENNVIFIPSDGNYSIQPPATVIADGRAPATITADTKRIYLKEEPTPRYMDVATTSDVWICSVDSNGGRCTRSTFLRTSCSPNSYVFVANPSNPQILLSSCGVSPELNTHGPALDCSDYLSKMRNLDRNILVFTLDGIPLHGVSQGSYYVLAWTDGDSAELNGPARFLGAPIEGNFYLSASGMRITVKGSCAFFMVEGPNHRGDWLNFNAGRSTLRIPILSDATQCNDAFCVDLLADDDDNVAYTSFAAYKDVNACVNARVDGNVSRICRNLRAGEIALDVAELNYHRSVTLYNNSLFVFHRKAETNTPSEEQNTSASPHAQETNTPAPQKPRLVLPHTVVLPLSIGGAGSKYAFLINYFLGTLCTNDRINPPKYISDNPFAEVPGSITAPLEGGKGYITLFYTTEAAAAYQSMHPYVIESAAHEKGDERWYLRYEIEPSEAVSVYCDISPIKPVCMHYRHSYRLWCGVKTTTMFAKNTGQSGTVILPATLRLFRVSPSGEYEQYAVARTNLVFFNISGCYAFEKEGSNIAVFDVNSRSLNIPLRYVRFDRKCMGLRLPGGGMIDSPIIFASTWVPDAVFPKIDGVAAGFYPEFFGRFSPGDRIHLTLGMYAAFPISGYDLCQYCAHVYRLFDGKLHTISFGVVPAGVVKGLYARGSTYGSLIAMFHYKFLGTLSSSDLFEVRGNTIINNGPYPVCAYVYPGDSNDPMMNFFIVGRATLSLPYAAWKRLRCDTNYLRIRFNIPYDYSVVVPLKGFFLLRMRQIRINPRFPAASTFNYDSNVSDVISSPSTKFYSSIPGQRPVVLFSKWPGEHLADIYYLWDPQYVPSACQTSYCCSVVPCDRTLATLSLLYAQKHGITSLDIKYLPFTYSAAVKRRSYPLPWHKAHVISASDGNSLELRFISEGESYWVNIHGQTLDLNAYLDPSLYNALTSSQPAILHARYDFSTQRWILTSTDPLASDINNAREYYALWFALSNIVDKPPEKFPYAVYADWSWSSVSVKVKPYTYYATIAFRGWSTQINTDCQIPEYLWGVGRIRDANMPLTACLPTWCTWAPVDLQGIDMLSQYKNLLVDSGDTHLGLVPNLPAFGKYLDVNSSGSS